MLFGSAACSSGVEECDPPIAPGTRYKVTILNETEGSDKCHVARLQDSFEMEAATRGTTCGLTPARWAPAPTPTGLQLVTCSESQLNMLGARCEIFYESNCKGWIDFSVYQPPGVQIDWSSPTINNLLFRVADDPDCLELGRTKCLDEYNVVLQRL